MTIAPCPRCDDPVSLPDHASPQATVRCPLCQETFAITDILASLPPALIVVEDPGADADEPTTPVVVDEAADAPVFPGPTTEPPSPAEPFSIQSSSVSASTSPTAARGGRPGYKPRARKQKNPAIEVTKIVLGGIAGLVIAQLILWWIPWKDKRRDFGVGPKVAKVLPWVVPEAFRGEGSSSKGESSSLNDRDQREPPIAPAAANGNTPGLSSSGLPEREFVAPGSASSTPFEDRVADRPPQSNGGRKESLAGPPDDPFGLAVDPPLNPDLSAEDPMQEPSLDLMPDEGVLDSTTPPEGISLDLELLDQPLEMVPDESTLEPSTEATERSAANRPQNAPQTTAAELEKSLADAQTQIAKWKGTAREQMPTQFPVTYEAIAQLGESLAWRETVADAQREQTAGLLRSLTEDPVKLDILARGTILAWLNKEDRPSDGLLVVGQVQSVRPLGRWFVSEVRVAGTEKTIAVVSEDDPAAAGRYQQDDSVLILGAQVERTQAQFADYQGPAETLAWYGTSVTGP